MRNFISKRAGQLKPSGIRKFFDIASTMQDVISLGVGEPDFVTPWHIREVAIRSLEDGETYYTSNNGMLELRNEISKYLKETSQFFHTRWYEKGYFGDKLILQLKDGKTPLAASASVDNMAYLDMVFKMGPKVLISLYYKDKLITQDAHMTSNSSIGRDGLEWKNLRGFYVDSPIDKIVIEFIGDAKYEQVFAESSLRSIRECPL